MSGTSLFLKFNDTQIISSCLAKVDIDLEDAEEYCSYDEDDGLFLLRIASSITGQESLCHIQSFCEELKRMRAQNKKLFLQFDVLEQLPLHHTRLHLDSSTAIKALAQSEAGLQYIAFPDARRRSTRRVLESFFLIGLSVKQEETHCPLWEELAREGLSEDEHIDFVCYKNHRFILLSHDVWESYNTFIIKWLKRYNDRFKHSDYATLYLSYFMSSHYTEVTISSQCLKALYRANLSLSIDIHKAFYIDEEDYSAVAQLARYIFASKKWRDRINNKG